MIVYILEENELGERSFRHIIYWHNETKKFYGDIPIVVFANKIDLVNEANLDHTEIQNLVDERNFLGYYLTSAKTGENVLNAFNTIIDKLYYDLNLKV
ncbi:MAG: hypothetical protein CEE43_03845 [Promethearchaeota archaeon Loki_b32]|nr:MAG: hypothetical protein CEE43_03845 [Candidatus Lokiarchaeota archaeon Loki_b32]